MFRKLSQEQVFFNGVRKGLKILNVPLLFTRIRGVHHTGGPRYTRSFYMRIRLFTYEKLVEKAKFLVNVCLFICEFSIRGPT